MKRILLSLAVLALLGVAGGSAWANGYGHYPHTVPVHHHYYGGYHAYYAPRAYYALRVVVAPPVVVAAPYVVPVPTFPPPAYVPAYPPYYGPRSYFYRPYGGVYYSRPGFSVGVEF